MSVESPTEFFDEFLPKIFNAQKAAGVDAVVQMTITGTQGGEWFVTIKNGRLNVNKGVHAKPDLFLKMTQGDFLGLVNRKISAEKAFFTGKIQFKGNIALALKLREAGFL